MPHVEYEHNGEKWPSVTEVTSLLSKPALYRWYAEKGWDECERIKNESTEYGRDMHAAIEAYFRGEPIADKFTGLVSDLYREWIKPNNVEVLALEEHLVSEKLRYHGTPDLVCKVNGINTIVDFKSNNRLYHEMVLQPVGYRLLWNETHPLVDQAILVRIDKKSGKIHPTVYTDLHQYDSVFLGLRHVWNFVNKRGDFECLRTSSRKSKRSS